MKPLSRLSKLASTFLLTGALLLCPSCKSSRNQWSFSVTRSVYGSAGSTSAHINYPVHCGKGDNGAATALVVLILLPIAIDLIILPVTLTHDLCT